MPPWLYIRVSWSFIPALTRLIMESFMVLISCGGPGGVGGVIIA